MNKPGGFLLAGAVALSLFLLPASRAFAQPTNDYCTNAVTLTLDVPFVMNTVDATSDGDPTNICGAPFGKGVWFEVIPPRNGKLTLSTCESDFDTVLEVYTGSCDSFTQVVCADDTGPVCNNDKASVSFLVGAGAHYFIVVGGSGGASGNLSIEATMDPPPNDQCSGAIPLTAGTPYFMSTASATETNDPVPPCQPGFGRGVWFQFTATNTGPLTVSTYGSDLYTALEVFTGSCGALIPLTCDSSDGPGPGGARGTVHFQGTNGTTYLILVGGYYGGIKSGNIQILAEEGSLDNDLCSGAIPMVDGTTYTMRTTSATSSGDPQPACNFPAYGFGNGVWYSFTPVTNGVATISTCGSDFDTSMQIYTGSCGALTAITDGCSYHTRSDCETNRASATFEAEAGVSYHILVGGINSEAGHLVIQATLSAPLPNDRYTNAIPMTKDAVYTENTSLATSAGDPTYTYVCVATANKGVWYSFTPASDGVVTVNTCGSDFDTFVAIFTNNCIECYATTDGCNNDNGPACPGNRASVAFLGKAGANYLIFAAGNNGAFGNLSIQATVQPPLPNDQCSNAITLTNGVSFTMNTAAATSINDEGANCLYNDHKGVWFSFTPVITNNIIIGTEGSDYTPVIAVYTGDCGHLTNVTCGTGAYFLGNAGQTYLIEAGGMPNLGEITGNLKITATGEPPFNDQSSGAFSMAPGIIYATNTTYATSTNDPLPLCDSTASRGVWYNYLPPTDAQVTVETCDSDFETVLQVYRLEYPSLIPIACNDGFGPACATNRASVSFFGNSGTNYFILAAGKNGAFGNLRISANGPPLTNDTCDTAIDMTEGVVYATNTTYASSIGDAFPVTKGIWYKFTPTRPGLLQISTCGSDFKTAFNVYTGACNALTYYNGAVADGFGICKTNASVEFPITPGTTYYIDAGGYIGASGNLSIAATMPPPANDTCANASPLTNFVFYRVNTANATETGDPMPVCQTNFGKGVWFTFTPPNSGTVSVNTCGGDLDSVLQIYTGSCGALVPLAGSCNDDAGPDCEGFTASLHFHGEAGVTYWILAGGYGGAGGNLGISAYVLPVINMSRAGTNWVVSWPSTPYGFWPQFATNLTPPIFWNSVTGAFGSSQDANYFLTNSIPGKSIFYRLKR